ncbi:MAG: TlpA disulfide reductase family protein [Candidatus Wallbacteria bacterium]
MLKRTAFILVLIFGILILANLSYAGKVGENFKEISAAGWLNSEGAKIADSKGKITVLEFWATWCPPCRASIPHLIELYNQYKDKGVNFISLTAEEKSVVEPFAKEMKMPYTIGFGSNTSKDYNVKGIPTAFIIGADGKIAWEGHPMMGLDEALKAEVAKSPQAAPAGTNEVSADKAAAPKEPVKGEAEKKNEEKSAPAVPSGK